MKLPRDDPNADDEDVEFLRWHGELCREDASRFYQDHLRYEYLRRLNVPQFQALFMQALKSGERFDDLVDAALMKGLR